MAPRLVAVVELAFVGQSFRVTDDPCSEGLIMLAKEITASGVLVTAVCATTVSVPLAGAR